MSIIIKRFIINNVDYKSFQIPYHFKFDYGFYWSGPIIWSWAEVQKFVGFVDYNHFVFEGDIKIFVFQLLHALSHYDAQRVMQMIKKEALK
jgi:hypothetical protein